MNPDDPTPLAKQGADPMVQALLRAGQRDRAPSGSEDRMLSYLGVGGAVGGAGIVAALARVVARLGGKNVVVASMATAAVVGVGLWALLTPPQPTPPVNVPHAPASAAPAVAIPPVPSITPEPSSSALPTTRVEDLPSPAAIASVVASAPVVVARAPVADAGASLAREVELIEAARRAITRGEPNAGLRVLDTYDREAPAGTLQPEARILRQRARELLGREP